MSIFSKPFLYAIGACGILTLSLIGAGLKISSLAAANEILEKSNKELSKKADELTSDKATLKANLTNCDVALASQNEAIKAAAVKIDKTPSKEVERIKKIYVKDESCEAELAAYKELFLDFADEPSPSLRPAPAAGPRTKDLSDLADKIKGKK